MAKARWSYPLYRLAWSGLDWVFPSRCGGCGKAGSRWCNKCQEKISLPAGRVCGKCGLPVKAEILCKCCRMELPPLCVLRAWAAFDFPARQALHKVTPCRGRGLDDALAVALLNILVSLSWSNDLILPVPLGRRRLQERGYNQVDLIARSLVHSLGLDYRPAALKRKREPASQVGNSAAERCDTMQNVFHAEPLVVRGKTVLVMEDVFTTGSILLSRAKALLQAGARDVFALAVARALPHHGLRQA